MAKEILREALEEGAELTIKGTKETAVITTNLMVDGVKVSVSSIHHAVGLGRSTLSVAGKVLAAFFNR